MKIQIMLTVDVSPEAWDREYHCGTSRNEVRVDVVRYVDTLVQAMVDTDGSQSVASVVVRSFGRESR